MTGGGGKRALNFSRCLPSAVTAILVELECLTFHAALIAAVATLKLGQQTLSERYFRG